MKAPRLCHALLFLAALRTASLEAQTVQLANNATSTLASSITSSATSLSVVSAVTFPGTGIFWIRIDDELLLVTAVSGATFTVTRGFEGTTAASHSAGVQVKNVITAAMIDSLFAQRLAAGLADNAVTNAKLRDSGALSVIGRSANSSGDPADISATAASDAVLRESGSSIGWGTVATAGLAADAVTDAKLRNSAALSVVGRSANSTGDPADIAAGSDGDVLRRAGTALGFGTVAIAGGGTGATTRSAANLNLGRYTQVKVAADTVTATTTLHTDSELSLPVLANEKWVCDWTGVFSSSAFADVKLGWAVPSGTTMLWQSFNALGQGATSTSTTVNTESQVDQRGGGTADFMYAWRALIFVSSTAGNVQPRFTQNTSEATYTIQRPGSALVCNKLN